MSEDPLTDHLRMRSIHQYRFWWLFDEGGKPSVLYRRRKRRSKDDVGELVVEWGDLEHSEMTPEAKRILTSAWDEYQGWRKAMT